jgi:ribosomal protein S1
LVSYDPTGSDNGKHVTLGETVRVIVSAYDPSKRRFSGQLG